MLVGALEYFNAFTYKIYKSSYCEVIFQIKYYKGLKFFLKKTCMLKIYKFFGIIYLKCLYKLLEHNLYSNIIRMAQKN